MSMVVTRRFVVIGHVQGVGFRMFAVDAARAEGLTGWVRNHIDGTVEVLAEGALEPLRRFEARLRQGPSRSRIDRITVEDETPSGHLSGFTIRG